MGTTAVVLVLVGGVVGTETVEELVELALVGVTVVTVPFAEEVVGEVDAAVEEGVGVVELVGGGAGEVAEHCAALQLLA